MNGRRARAGAKNYKAADLAENARLEKEKALYVTGASLLLVLLSFATRGPTAFFTEASAGVTSFFGSDLAAQAAYALAFFIAVALILTRPRNGNEGFFASLFFSVSGLLVYAIYALGNCIHILLAIGGSCLGIGVAFFLMIWIDFLSYFEIQTGKKLLLISNLVSVPLCLALTFCPMALRIVLVALVTLPGVTACTALALPILREARSIPRDTNVSKIKSAASKLITAIICAAMFFTVYALTNYGWNPSETPDRSSNFIPQAGTLVAVGILAILWFKLNISISIEQMYTAMFPILATLFLAGHFLSGWLLIVLSFIGSICMALMSIMMTFICIEVSRNHRVSCQVIYGLFAGIVYLAKVPQTYMRAAFATPGASPNVSVLSLLLYLITIPLLWIVTRRFNRISQEDPVQRKVFSDPSNQSACYADPIVDVTDRRCLIVAQAHDLSNRQTEILMLLAKGRDVPFIASSLSLAESTVKGYKKALYSALGIHSKKELLDLIDAVPLDISSQAEQAPRKLRAEMEQPSEEEHVTNCAAH